MSEPEPTKAQQPESLAGLGETVVGAHPFDDQLALFVGAACTRWNGRRLQSSAEPEPCHRAQDDQFRRVRQPGAGGLMRTGKTVVVVLEWYSDLSKSEPGLET